MRLRTLGRLVLVTVVPLALGCETRVIDVDRFDVTDPRYVIDSNPQADGKKDVVLVVNGDVLALKSDGQRVYWVLGIVDRPVGWDTPHPSYLDKALQSCRPDACRSTFVTYAQSNDNFGLDDFTANGNFIAWGQDCIPGGPRVDTVCGEIWGRSLLNSNAEAVRLTSGYIVSYVMTERLYWWTRASVPELHRCDSERCADTSETIHVADGQAPAVYVEGLVLSNTHAYWREGSSWGQGRSTIRRIALEGERQVETMADSETYVTGISVRESSLYWAVNNYSSPVQTCSLDDCANTKTTLVGDQEYPSWTATTMTHLVWAASGVLRACQLSSCEDSVETVANQALAYFATDDALYYTTASDGGSATLIHRRAFP
jgi:hypothetical protein